MLDLERDLTLDSVQQILFLFFLGYCRHGVYPLQKHDRVWYFVLVRGFVQDPEPIFRFHGVPMIFKPLFGARGRNIVKVLARHTDIRIKEQQRLRANERSDLSILFFSVVAICSQGSLTVLVDDKFCFARYSKFRM